MRLRQTFGSIAVPPDLNRMSDELVSTWILSFSRMNWAERLELLEQVDEQIHFRVEDQEMSRSISQLFTAKLIERMRGGVVSCLDQAYVYLNSADHIHHEAARVWMVLSQTGHFASAQDMASKGVPGSEKRTNQRLEVNLDGVMAANDNSYTVKLIDVSSGGAKVSVPQSLPKGTQVYLDVPLLGRVAACVVWVAATFVGLSFVTQQVPGLVS